MKKKLGRPRLPKDAAKGQVIRARVSGVEHAKIERAAKTAKAKLSDWVRNTLLKAAE
jgi:uncharacterized protein (DUF1778 family)